MDFYLDKPVSVITCDGRNILGTMRGCDQATNVILEKSVENVYSLEGITKVSLGLYIIRGSNIVLIGEYGDEYFKGLVQDEGQICYQTNMS